MICKERFSTTEIDLQMYENLANNTFSEIQARINESMEQIKNSINRIVLCEVLKNENRNN